MILESCTVTGGTRAAIPRSADWALELPVAAARALSALGRLTLVASVSPKVRPWRLAWVRSASMKARRSTSAVTSPCASITLRFSSVPASPESNWPGNPPLTDARREPIEKEARSTRAAVAVTDTRAVGRPVRNLPKNNGTSRPMTRRTALPSPDATKRAAGATVLSAE